MNFGRFLIFFSFSFVFVFGFQGFLGLIFFALLFGFVHG